MSSSNISKDNQYSSSNQNEFKINKKKKSHFPFNLFHHQKVQCEEVATIVVPNNNNSTEIDSLNNVSILDENLTKKSLFKGIRHVFFKNKTSGRNISNQFIKQNIIQSQSQNNYITPPHHHHHHHHHHHNDCSNNSFTSHHQNNHFNFFSHGTHISNHSNSSSFDYGSSNNHCSSGGFDSGSSNFDCGGGGGGFDSGGSFSC